MTNGKEKSCCGLEFTSENSLKEHKWQAKYLRQKRPKTTGLVERSSLESMKRFLCHKNLKEVIFANFAKFGLFYQS